MHKHVRIPKSTLRVKCESMTEKHIKINPSKVTLIWSSASKIDKRLYCARENSNLFYEISESGLQTEKTGVFGAENTLYVIIISKICVGRQKTES